MGKFSDTLKEQNLSPELYKAVGSAESIFGAVSGASAYYGAAYAIGEQLGLWGTKQTDFDRLTDAINKVVVALKEGFAAILEGQEAQGQQDKIDKLLLAQADALGALSLLRNGAEGASLTANQKDLLIANTNHAATFMDPSLWNLPYYSQSAHTDPWSKTLEPPHDTSVQAFAIVLPRYLQAIAHRVTALTAALPHPFKKTPAPGEPAGYHGEIMDHVATLERIHDTIREVIVPLRIPSLTEMLPQVQSPDLWVKPPSWKLLPSDWEKGKRLFGAVEKYSTTASLTTYPDLEPSPPKPADFPVDPGHVPPGPGPEPAPPSRPLQPSDYPHYGDYKKAFDQYATDFKAHHYPLFLARHAAGSLREQKVVYNAVGLGCLWTAMNHLRLMAEEVLVPVSNPTAGLSVRHGTWSIREFVHRLDAVGVSVPIGNLTFPIGSLPGPVTIRSLGKVVGIPPAFVNSLRQVFLDEAGRVP